MCSKECEVTSEWKTLRIPRTHIGRQRGAALTYNDPNNGIVPLIASSFKVYIEETIQVRKGENGWLYYRNQTYFGTWHDTIDANSFPGIQWLDGDDKNVFDNDDEGVVAPVVEGMWDLIFDKALNTEFDIEVRYGGRVTSTTQVDCAKFWKKFLETYREYNPKNGI